MVHHFTVCTVYFDTWVGTLKGTSVEEGKDETSS